MLLLLLLLLPRVWSRQPGCPDLGSHQGSRKEGRGLWVRGSREEATVEGEERRRG